MSVWSRLLGNNKKSLFDVNSYIHQSTTNGSWGSLYNPNYYELSLNVAAINQAIITISGMITAGKIVAYDNNGELDENEPLIELLKNPNSDQTFNEFMETLVRNTLASGYSYLVPYAESVANKRRLDKVGTSNAPKLEVLISDYIHFDTNNLYGLFTKRLKNSKIEYRVNNQNIQLNTSDLIVIWDKSQSPNNELKGISRLDSLQDEINNIILANRGKTNKIKLSGHTIVHSSTKSSQGMFSENLTDSVSIEDPNYTQKDLIEDKFESKGLAQGKSITVTPVELSSFNLMEGIKDVDFTSEKQGDERQLYGVYGIPKELQNLDDNAAKYENRTAARLEVFENVVQPLVAKIFDNINNFYQPKSKVGMDFSHLPFFQIYKQRENESKDKMYNRMVELYDKGIITETELKDKIKEYGII